MVTARWMRGPSGTKALAGLLLTLAVLVAPTVARADNRGAPSPLGYWTLEGREGVVQIYSCGSETLCGALVGIALTDVNGPMPMTWNHQSQCGFPFVGNLKRQGGDAWFGSITNPKNGKTYNARVKLASNGVLKLRGYLFVPALGQTQTWTRYPGVPPANCRMTHAQLGG